VIRRFLLLAAFAAALGGLMLPGSLIAIDARSLYYLWESGHLLLFFLGWHLVYGFCPPLAHLTFPRQLLLFLVATLVCIAMLEGLQSALSGNAVAVTDILGDMAGAILFLSFRYKREIKGYAILHGTALLLTGYVLWPFFCSLSNVIMVRYQFPLLADFETPFEADRFGGNTANVTRTSEQAFRGRHGLRLSLFPGPWSGVTMTDFPSDWQGYERLGFAVHNPGPQVVRFEVSVYDHEHRRERKPFNDCFSRRIDLPAGCWTKVDIPLSEVWEGPKSRKMDMAHIAGIGFFVSRENAPLTLYLDAIRLE